MFFFILTQSLCLIPLRKETWEVYYTEVVCQIVYLYCDAGDDLYLYKNNNNIDNIDKWS
jgi:hypothetical protein